MCLLCPGTIIHSVSERTDVTLKCPAVVGGSHFKRWSKETAGKQLQIGPDVSTDKETLTITDVQLGDSGLYHCDGKPAVYLNVTKGERQEINSIQFV